MHYTSFTVAVNLSGARGWHRQHHLDRSAGAIARSATPCLGTLAAMHELATSYAKAGRWQAARKLQEAVVRLSRKVNGPEDPGTL